MSAAEGVIARDEGMELALTKHTDWKIAFERAVTTLKAGKFTSEDVVNMIGLPNEATGLNKNNSVGAMMGGLSKRKVIRKTGRRRRSAHRTSHAAEITEWTGYGNEIITDDWVRGNSDKIVRQRDVAIALYKNARAKVLEIHYEVGRNSTGMTTEVVTNVSYCRQCKTVYPCTTAQVFK